MNKLSVPTIHLNGTSKDELFEQLCGAIDAMHEAETTLARAYPNARDYYPQGPDAIDAAMHQHESRMQKLKDVAAELQSIAEAFM